MIKHTDQDGTWEIDETAVGCVSKRLVEPSAEYLANNPPQVVSTTPTI